MKRFAIAAALVLGSVLGDENVENVQDETNNRVPYVNPIVVKTEKVFFWENFQPTNGESKPQDFGWVLSTHEEYSRQEPVIEAKDSGFDGDHGLILKKKHVRYGLSKKLDKPISLDDDELVLQFDARFHDKLSCSGGYIKFVAETEEDQKEFSEKTPYVIMFGADKCGHNEKTHVIFRHQNPVSKEFEEKHMKDVSKFTNDKSTHVYTLHMKKDGQNVKVYIDREEKASKTATEKDSFDPSFIPSEEIDDPEDKKPEDWVDEKMIADPDAKKPEDWVEEKLIVDPTSTKPDDWDDEEDGEWEPAKIENPEYKGEWKAPMIDNPKYKGPWAPKKIKNPHYFEQDLPLSNLPKISHVFIEVLSNDEGIEFDNILITSDSALAKKVAEEHSLEKQRLERAILSERELKEKKEERDKALKEDFSVSSVTNYITGEISELYERYPLASIGSTVAAGAILILVLLRNPRTKEDESTDAKQGEKKEEKSGVEEVTESDEDETEDDKDKVKRRKPRRAD